MMHVMPGEMGSGMEQPGVAVLALVAAATPLRVESALFEELLIGWRRQQLSRRLGGSLIDGRERTVRRCRARRTPPHHGRNRHPVDPRRKRRLVSLRRPPGHHEHVHKM
jgi:hypothetical protein